MFKLSDSQKAWLKSEAISILHTMLAFFCIDGLSALLQLYSGPWEQALWYQLGFSLLRSFVKALLTEVFPTVFKKSLPK